MKCDKFMEKEKYRRKTDEMRRENGTAMKNSRHMTANNFLPN